MDGKTAARVRLFVDPGKTHLVDMYKNANFNEAGKVTLREGFVANGDDCAIPADTHSTEELRALWETRYGLSMELLVDV